MKKNREKLNHSSSHKGFTLVEVLITVSILAIIMGVIGTLFMSGTKAYSTGQSSAFLQSDTRLSMELIQNEIRYARELTVISPEINIDADHNNEYSYIIYKNRKIVIHRQNGSGLDQMTLPGEYVNSDPEVMKPVFSVVLPSDPDDERQLMHLTLVGKYKGSDFNLETTLNLLNLSASEDYAILVNDPNGYAIKFLK